MGTIYKSKNGHIFDSIEYDAEDGKYAIDITCMQTIKAYPLSELTTLAKSQFDFICRFHPRYDMCDEAGWISDLDCLIDGECDEEKLENLTAIHGSDPMQWERDRDELLQELFNQACKSYLVNHIMNNQKLK